MEIEFDPVNRDKHGVSLAFGVRVFEDDRHVLIPSLRLIDGEERYKAIGLVAKRLWTAVHVRRHGKVRLISVRRSNDGEQAVYNRPPR